MFAAGVEVNGEGCRRVVWRWTGPTMVGLED